MSFFNELHHEQDGPSLARLHVAAQTRESAPLLHSPLARTGTSLCARYEQDGPSLARLHVAAQTRESAPLLRSPLARIGTSLCQGKVMS